MYPLAPNPTSMTMFVVAAACFIVTISVILFRKAYRLPLPGIPYNRHAANMFMGDLAELGEREKQPGGMKPWFLEQGRRHNSAITQVFLGPFAKPAVLLSDFREVNDVLSHRDGIDFKRGKKVDAFRGLIPHAFPSMETYDRRFKESRELVKDLMTPRFLHTVNAPRVHMIASNLVDLWRLKSKLAQGHPVDIFDNIVEFSLDAILSAATGLGPEGGDIKRQFNHLVTSEGPSDLSLDMNDIAKLDILPKSPKLRALEMSEEALSKSFYMPSPWLFHAVNDLRPSVGAAKRTIKSFVDSQVAAAVEKLHKNVEPESALDYIIHREIKSAEKSGRAPAVHDPRILDIIQCYMTAGHDTSTCSMLWIMRRLMADPEQQVKIRQSLRVTYREAYNKQRVPNAQELAKHSAYLEAFVEEVLRYNCPVPTILVMTKRDTVLLGHHIPADTQVFLNLTGPSLTTPSLAIQEEFRNHTARRYRHKAAHDNWDDFDPAAFRPERWLRQDERGTVIFSPTSGPSLSLSAGNRGCWGQKLGYLEIRIVLTLLLWSFKFDLPESLVSWETYDSLATGPRQCIARIHDAPIYGLD